jgi:hypothetical protein
MFKAPPGILLTVANIIPLDCLPGVHGIVKDLRAAEDAGLKSDNVVVVDPEPKFKQDPQYFQPGTTLGAASDFIKKFDEAIAGDGESLKKMAKEYVTAKDKPAKLKEIEERLAGLWAKHAPELPAPPSGFPHENEVGAGIIGDLIVAALK